MRTPRILSLAMLALVTIVFSQEMLAFKDEKLLDKAQEQVEALQLAKVNAIDAVREMKRLHPSETILDELAVKYKHAKDLCEVSSSQTAAALRGQTKRDPTMTETAIEAKRALVELATFAKDYEKQVTLAGKTGQEVEQLRAEKSRLATVADALWRNRDSIVKGAKILYKKWADINKENREAREKMAKDAEDAAKWPDFDKIQ